MAVVRGGADVGRPSASVAAFSPARSPEAADLTYAPRHRTSARQEERRAPSPALLRQHRRTVYVGVAVHHAVAHELGLFEPGNHAKHARLFAPLQLRLKPDEAEAFSRQIVLAKLHGGVRKASVVRGSTSPTGFIGPKRNVSTPRCAITSPADSLRRSAPLSKSRTVADSA